MSRTTGRDRDSRNPALFGRAAPWRTGASETKECAKATTRVRIPRRAGVATCKREVMKSLRNRGPTAVKHHHVRASQMSLKRKPRGLLFASLLASRQVTSPLLLLCYPGPSSSASNFTPPAIGGHCSPPSAQPLVSRSLESRLASLMRDPAAGADSPVAVSTTVRAPASRGDCADSIIGRHCAGSVKHAYSQRTKRNKIEECP